MKELLKNKKHISWREVQHLILLDTCFIIHSVKNNNKIKIKNAAITSFNIEELMKVEHKLGHLKKELRNFLKNTSFVIVDVPVSPGQWMQEKDFVLAVNHDLLKEVPDASDAVLMAAAIQTQSDVLTKDKHHLFTTKLENFLDAYSIRVYKELKDIQ
ncbi:MAG: hypothetical protein ABIJ18_04850 [archaeon]